jgi:hypothetical protein
VRSRSRGATGPQGRETSPDGAEQRNGEASPGGQDPDAVAQAPRAKPPARSAAGQSAQQTPPNRTPPDPTHRTTDPKPHPQARTAQPKQEASTGGQGPGAVAQVPRAAGRVGCRRLSSGSGGGVCSSPGRFPGVLRRRPSWPWAGAGRYRVVGGSRGAGRWRTPAVCPGSVPRPAEAEEEGSPPRRQRVRKGEGLGSAAGCRRSLMPTRRRNLNRLQIPTRPRTRCGLPSHCCSRSRRSRSRCPEWPYPRRPRRSAEPHASRCRLPTILRRAGRRRPRSPCRSRRPGFRFRFRPTPHPTPTPPVCPARSTAPAHPAYPTPKESDHAPKLPSKRLQKIPRSRNTVRPSPRLLCLPYCPTPLASPGPPGPPSPPDSSSRPRSRAASNPPKGTAARWDVAVPGRAALPCSCTPRFLVPGPPFVRVRAGVLLPLFVYVPASTPPSPGTAQKQSRPEHAYPPRRTAIPGAVERPAAFPPCVRVTLRVAPARTGTSPRPQGHLPGTSPYPAVILSGRLRS